MTLVLAILITDTACAQAARPLNCAMTVRFHETLGQGVADFMQAQLALFAEESGMQIQFEPGLSDADPTVFVDGVTTIYAFDDGSFGPEVIFTQGNKDSTSGRPTGKPGAHTVLV